MAQSSSAALRQAIQDTSSSNSGYMMALDTATILASETADLAAAFDQIDQGADVRDFTFVLNTVNEVDATA